VIEWVVAAFAVGALALRPRSTWSAAVALAAAALDVALGTRVGPAQ
jgi:hypothetical protein